MKLMMSRNHVESDAGGVVHVVVDSDHHHHHHVNHDYPDRYCLWNPLEDLHPHPFVHCDIAMVVADNNSVVLL